ncbi:MAG: transcription elongation factor GreA [Myxococcaceae bacterium]|nr:transcription elongation factor GreA [Myxococcaceae bacterium]MBH2005852.1 transcription elongation factor GreA [Myxococcaceae bacterium]
MSYPMTQSGFDSLTEELRRLKIEVRPKVIQDIAEARAHGDLSENAEYDAAREKQSLVEGRIREIEAKLAGAQIIDLSRHDGSKVLFGVTVVICDADSGEQQRWTLVGEDEADLKQGKINITSPIARALVGRSVGDQIEIQTPKGIKECEIVEILI